MYITMMRKINKINNDDNFETLARYLAIMQCAINTTRPNQ